MPKEGYYFECRLEKIYVVSCCKDWQYHCLRKMGTFWNKSTLQLQNMLFP